MGKGFLAGAGVGLVVSALVLGALSLMLPLSPPLVLPGGTGPGEAAAPEPGPPAAPGPAEPGRVTAPRPVLPQIPATPGAVARAPAPDRDPSGADTELPSPQGIAGEPEEDAAVAEVAPVAVVLIDTGLDADERGLLSAFSIPFTIGLDARRADLAEAVGAWQSAGQEVVLLAPASTAAVAPVTGLPQGLRWMRLPAERLSEGFLAENGDALTVAGAGIPFHRLEGEPAAALAGVAPVAAQENGAILFAPARADILAALTGRPGAQAGVSFAPLSALLDR
ncbi:hypothetical protein [Halodurantibacterium flavum]|uniref:DUF4350 domain-containing protein n=1 Tax=Halodurantibacterium flavum TaxID=1382802 RepID=A0ABW4S3X6_9RHOB